MTTTSQPLAPATSAASPRGVETIVRPPSPHWVGDGFRVLGYASEIPDAARKLDPFLLLDYHPPRDYPATTRPRGVGVHPHRGFETVTLAWQGSVQHHDSAGGGGVIGPGDVQWMTAASGVLHKEYHAPDWARTGGTFQMAQLWVNLPRAHKMDPPRYQALDADAMGEVELDDGAGRVRVIAGSFRGVAGPARTFTPIDLLDVRLEAGGTIDVPLPSRHNAALLILEGSVRIGATTAEAHDLVLLDHAGDRIALTAWEGAHVLVLSGQPIEEPVVQYGPFVMNTRREIVEAIEDLERGAFGRLED